MALFSLPTFVGGSNGATARLREPGRASPDCSHRGKSAARDDVDAELKRSTALEHAAL
jgi:hypothetical protein